MLGVAQDCVFVAARGAGKYVGDWSNPTGVQDGWDGYSLASQESWWLKQDSQPVNPDSWDNSWIPEEIAKDNKDPLPEPVIQELLATQDPAFEHITKELKNMKNQIELLKNENSELKQDLESKAQELQKLKESQEAPAKEEKETKGQDLNLVPEQEWSDLSFG